MSSGRLGGHRLYRPWIKSFLSAITSAWTVVVLQTREEHVYYIDMTRADSLRTDGFPRLIPGTGEPLENPAFRRPGGRIPVDAGEDSPELGTGLRAA